MTDLKEGALRVVCPTGDPLQPGTKIEIFLDDRWVEVPHVQSLAIVMGVGQNGPFNTCTIVLCDVALEFTTNNDLIARIQAVWRGKSPT
jgi:hypothetical protein